jgi:hypothetical protein
MQKQNIKTLLENNNFRNNQNYVKDNKWKYYYYNFVDFNIIWIFLYFILWLLTVLGFTILWYLLIDIIDNFIIFIIMHFFWIFIFIRTSRIIKFYIKSKNKIILYKIPFVKIKYHNNKYDYDKYDFIIVKK